ncbi:hypothetical protein BGZ99_003833 [Dissophora globulifera]|uniref:Uncharacterized protein n=1 Tax=Dissophora globulifera TaxID=979702 RepID=A0A9P6RTI2_9FUNG|nr:hypothetical protein BGZ99_003833 [Dissophora globulifera]
MATSQALSLSIKNAHMLEKQANILTASSLPAETRDTFHKSLLLYERFFEYFRQSRMVQADLIRDEFLQHCSMLQSAMASNRELQEQMLKMQRVILDAHPEALDRLVAIQNRAQAILTQTLQLHDHPVPRLFILLPEDSARWDNVQPQQDKLRLYFLCECGDHTPEAKSSNLQYRIHLTQHEGYALENAAEFFQRYGPYSLDLLQISKYVASTRGLTIHEPLRVGSTSPGEESTGLRDGSSIELGISQAIKYVMDLSFRDDWKLIGNGSKKHVRQMEEDKLKLSGSDLQRLATFLVQKDPTQPLGNLYRITTDSGHAKWICPDHYHEIHSLAAIKTFREMITLNRGTFLEHLGRVEVRLGSSAVALSVYKALERCKFVLEFKVSLQWDVSVNDLKVLRDALQHSRIVILDLTCRASNSPASDILSRSKRSNPLWEIMMNPTLQSFILSDYIGFFSRVTIPPQTTGLRVLKISELLNWKKESLKVMELLGKCPQLHELDLVVSQVDAAYTEIKSLNYDFCSLEQLVLDNRRDLKAKPTGIRVRFKKGVPFSMDLTTADMSSPFFKDTRYLQSLHLHPGVHLSRVNVASHWLTSLVSHSSNMTRLVIQCDASDFLRLHVAVLNGIAHEADGHKLRVLCMYGGRNLIMVNDMQGEASVELELMSSLPRETVEALMRVHSGQLTKISAGLDLLNALIAIVREGGELALQHVEMTASQLNTNMLQCLPQILEACAPTLTHLAILVDRAWEPAKTERRRSLTLSSSSLADFIVEFGPRWTQIAMHETQAQNWLRELKLRGYVPSDSVYKNRAQFIEHDIISTTLVRLMAPPPHGE